MRKEIRSIRKEIQGIEKEIKKIEKRHLEKINKRNLTHSKENLEKAKRYYESFKKKKSKMSELKRVKEYLLKAKAFLIKIDGKTELTNHEKIKKSIVILYLVFTIIFFIGLSIIFGSLTKFIINIFSKFIGSYQFAQILLWSIYVIVIVLVLIELIVAANIIDYGKPKINWLVLTLILMVAFFFISTFYIHISIGQDDLDLFLRNSTDMSKVGRIDCQGSSNNLLKVDEKIVCNILSPKLENYSIKVQFTYINNSKSELQPLKNDSFIAPSDIKYIFFQVIGTNSDGKVYDLNIGNPYHFFTLEESEILKRDFIHYLTIISTIIFISIPLIMEKLKRLAE